MQKLKFVLGLDIGISSVGWGILRLDEEENPNRIIDTGVKIFTPGEVPKTGASKNLERREKRGIRRVLRRRAFRVDRVKHLLNLSGYLGNEIITGVVSEVNDKLTKIYTNMINNYYNDKNITPYDLKVRALDQKLNKDELSIILVHYAKHRGYKSNRSDDDTDKNAGKLKAGIKQNEEIMKKENYRTVSEMFIKDKERFGSRIRNTSDDYKMCVTREMYLKEIKQVLDSQVNFGLITPEFKEEYIDIWQSQRHYAKGPGGNSKYGGDLIKRMTGTCLFDGKPRAPRFAPSSEIFVALTKLINFRYRTENSLEYQKLSSEEINKIINLAKSKNDVTYANIFKELKIENGIIKALSATKKEIAKAIEKIKKEYSLKEFNYQELTIEQKNKYDSYKRDEINKRSFISLKAYSDIRKLFSTKLGTDKWEEIKDNYEFLDLIVNILTDYKLNEDIIDNLKKNNIDEIYYDLVLELPNYKEHMRLSLDLIRDLNMLMIGGKSYDQAMSELNLVHSNPNNNNEKEDQLIPINQNKELNNQRVIRSLAQARGIINSIIKKYGMPYKINIETARELAKTKEERNKIAKRQEENRDNNENIKKELVNLYPTKFGSTDKVKAFDILKYKLWKEQLEYCTYSLEPISVTELFDDNLVQVDHILPYSRTFNDTYFNKTLVKSKYNQEKGNKTPYEWFGKTEKWNSFKNLITSLDIPEEKKDNYLLDKLTPEMESEYRNQNLNDTKFISKYLVSYIKANLSVPHVGSPSGSITGKLRNYWHLNGLTHSLESESYYLSNIDKQDKKNRENHLHHAMDAIIIAATNDTIIKRVTSYEKYKRILDNKPLETIKAYANNINEEFEIDSFIDPVTGECYEESLKSYIDYIISKSFFNKKKNNTIKTYLPEPYENFCNEAKVRVYERDKKIMDFKLKEFGYTQQELANAMPIIPKFAKPKVGGKLHGETYYALRKRKSGNEEIASIVSRMNIISESFDSKKLEKIVEKDSGSKIVYETIKEWLGEHKNGSEAFKKNGGYPRNPKTGNIIKKIKIEDAYSGKGHIIDNKVVDKENIYQIDVYKKDNEDKLYFVAYDTLDLYKIKSKKNKKGEIIKASENIDIDLWWGQASNHKIMKYNDLLANFKLEISLSKNDFIEIELNNVRKGLGYVVGFTSGKLEIASPLGDGLDLIDENNLFSSVRSQFQLTISTIKAIKKIKLNNLGKIE